MRRQEHTPPDPLAVIFDVDGTLVDSERDGHRAAFNAAFAEAGLGFCWEVEEYGQLLTVTGGDRRIRHYLVGLGMDRSVATEHARSLHARKTELFVELVVAGRVAPRPGVRRLLEELVAAGVLVGVATTGRASWVLPLLETSFTGIAFDAVITGDDVDALKPDPSAYRCALAQLEVPPDRAVAVEDSRNGLMAATAAGLPCVVVANEYSSGQSFTEAALVLDGFGEPGTSALVLADPGGHATRVDRLDHALLRQLCARTAAET